MHFSSNEKFWIKSSFKNQNGDRAVSSSVCLTIRRRAILIVKRYRLSLLFVISTGFTLFILTIHVGFTYGGRADMYLNSGTYEETDYTRDGEKAEDAPKVMKTKTLFFIRGYFGK